MYNVYRFDREYGQWEHVDCFPDALSAEFFVMGMSADAPIRVYADNLCVIELYQRV